MTELTRSPRNREEIEGKESPSLPRMHAFIPFLCQLVSQHIFIKCLLCVKYLAISLGHSKTNISTAVKLTF